MGRILMWILGGVTVLAMLLAGGWIASAYFIEQARYRSLARDGAFELRDYPSLRVAEVRREGPRDAAIRSGFSPLAGYIFANERDGEKIAMTAPVTQLPAAPAGGASGGALESASDGWAVRFIMPNRYALDDLPAPASAEVRLTETPPQRMAAIRFSGAWRDALFQDKTEKLRAWIAEQGLEPAGPPTFAYYNDPFTPGFMRRNEVMIPVAQ
ncbi:MAG: heme-binding protein [Pseudomonadota bacterium]